MVGTAGRRLTQQAFTKAQTFILEQGRVLEQHRFTFRFGDGDPAPVISALAAYQNEDGGFGNALEPDLRCPESSALATSEGLSILREVGTAADEPVVARAARYLLDTYDAERGVWPIIPAAAAEHPHAPWWTYDKVAEVFGGFKTNPTIGIIGHLQHYSALLPDGFLAPRLDNVARQLEALPEPADMYDIYCYLRLLTADGLPEPLAEAIREKMIALVAATVEREPAKWSGHCMPPLDAAPSPDSPMVAALPRELIERHLDDLIDAQDDDGAWPVPWDWMGTFPDDWPRAETEWKGVLALQHLRALAAYGRIEGMPAA